ncbi:bifunctional AP-4-A phosphorylase/ADP sulfurylase [Coemansia sp. RSA 1358]|nr:bifunctional AP-4-A phosphorylase/ADP sulfurylase [Coemansia umbellata]KAJ2625366.1 bifunctional AP-4-A phosphorylase/ADP sulfurylase [Coemansia sp. RSA 1358]
MSRALDSLVRERYASAIAQGALLFTESTIQTRKERDVEFEIRFVPALAKKPSSKPKERMESKEFINPFLPFDKRLFVKSLGSSHNLLLNKYCVVPYHLLITTAEFRQQGEPLTQEDFSATLDVLNNTSSQHIVFYNSGEESGASQPHKHLQLLPMPEYIDAPPSVDLWLRDKPAPDTVHTSSSLPFAHFGVRFSNETLTPSMLINAYSTALGALTSKFGQDSSYNMVLTTSAIILFPRSWNSWHGIGVNSLGFAGLFLCKTRDELLLISQVGIFNILAQVGVTNN